MENSYFGNPPLLFLNSIQPLLNLRPGFWSTAQRIKWNSGFQVKSRQMQHSLCRKKLSRVVCYCSRIPEIHLRGTSRLFQVSCQIFFKYFFSNCLLWSCKETQIQFYALFCIEVSVFARRNVVNCVNSWPWWMPPHLPVAPCLELHCSLTVQIR